MFTHNCDEGPVSQSLDIWGINGVLRKFQSRGPVRVAVFDFRVFRVNQGFKAENDHSFIFSRIKKQKNLPMY